MPLSWNNHVVALCAFATLASCSLEEQTASWQDEEPASDGKTRRSSSRDASADDDARDGGVATRTSTRAKPRNASADGGDAGEPEPPKKKTKKADAASESQEPEESKPDAGGSPDDSRGDEDEMEPPKDDGDAECTRTRLTEKADEYLKSMASGDTMSLSIHSSFRYTENGREEPLGAGAWLRRGDAEFARHVLDETLCSSFTQAVMGSLTGRFSLGVRLRYTEGQLLEAEAQVVPELLAATDLDAIIPMGEDSFLAEVPKDERMSRDELFDFARRYFDSATGASDLPPSAPDCRRLQNGLPLGDGTCTEPPGTVRFEQQRFDLADEPNGIVTATVLYNGHIGFYLLKISDEMLQNIQVIGGASSQATGW